MRNLERQQWTEYVRRMEERKDKKPRKPHARKKPEVSQAECGAALDDLTRCRRRKGEKPDQASPRVVNQLPL